MKTALIATVAALTLGSGVALAQATPAPERGQAVTQDQMLQRAAARFDRRDANGDGVLNAADRSARADRAFARMDANSDGMISRAEWDAVRAKRNDRREARAERRGRSGGKGMERRLGRADGNGDVTRAEAMARATERFATLDANRDGSVTREERQAARAARRAGR